MAYTALKSTVSRLLAQTVTKSHVIDRCILPSSCVLLQRNGNPSTNCQQVRTKKTYKEYKFNKPLDFSYAGDFQPEIDVQKHTLLFKYRDCPEIEQLPDHLKKLFTAEYATSKEILEHRHMVLQDYMSKELGPGHNLEKQISYLTVKIRNLIPKTMKGRSNKPQKVHLIERIAKRNKFLGYLRHLDFERYEWIQNEIGIAYKPHDKYKYFRKGRKAPAKKAAREFAIAEVEKKLEECEDHFNGEMKKLYKEKKKIIAEIEEYDLDREKLAEVFKKDMDDRFGTKPKMSPKFREYFEEKKKKDKEEYYVF